MATIAKLLFDLARDESGIRGEFERDPRGVMRSRGLSEGQQAIVLGGDLEAIRHAIDYEYATDSEELREILPSYGEPAPVALIVTWHPVIPTWGPPPPPPPDQ